MEQPTLVKSSEDYLQNDKRPFKDLAKRMFEVHVLESMSRSNQVEDMGKDFALNNIGFALNLRLGGRF